MNKGLKILWRHLKEYKKDLILLAFLGIISAIANASIPYLTGRLLDSILSPSKIFTATKFEMPFFLFFVLLWLVLKLAADFVDWRTGLKREYLGITAYANYMIKGFGALLELPVSFHKSNKLGSVVDRIHRAANAMDTITSNVIVNLAPQFLSIFVALSVSFYKNSLLASFLLVGLAVYLIILLKIIRPLAKLHRKMHETFGEAFGDANDALFNIQPVKQAVAEKYEQRKLFKNFYLKTRKLRQQLVAIWRGINFYQRLIITLTQLAIFAFSIIFVRQGKMTIGDLVMFNGYAMMVFGPFAQLGNYWQAIQNGLAALERSEKVLFHPKENYLPKNPVILADLKGEIVFENVSFAYQKKQNQIIENINFAAKAGEVIALVGESGVGKTTLADLISGYYAPKEGKILIDGHDIKRLDLKFLRSKISVVPQEIILFNDTVKNNIKYGSFGATDEEVEKAAEVAHADEFIAKFSKKYEQIVGERGIKLSSGQKQRISIARAILRNPRILILDEPTSSLDALSEKYIQESLEKLMKNRTTFIIAHRLSTVRKADKIMVLDQGKIAEQGRHEDLIQIPNGIYRGLYELQIGLK